MKEREQLIDNSKDSTVKSIFKQEQLLNFRLQIHEKYIGFSPQLETNKAFITNYQSSMSRKISNDCLKLRKDYRQPRTFELLSRDEDIPVFKLPRFPT
ncbi:UNVERIFIED_CONTAM: hypothetical protein NCL1_34365 [Trichonephila clavipes]